MRGKTCIITGATGGIGLETARRLGALGARLVLVGRNRDKGNAAISRLRAEVPGVAVEMHHADLSRPDEIRRLADALLKTASRIDVLVNNAGAVFANRNTTPDGLELTFALNHMGYFRLMALLRDRLIASAPARVVNVASEAHRGSHLDFEDLQCSRRYRGWKAYQRSKLANILFTRELARRLEGPASRRIACTRASLRAASATTIGASGVWALPSSSWSRPSLLSAEPKRRSTSHHLPTSTGSAGSTSVTVASGSPMRRLKTTKRRRGFGRRASSSQTYDPRKRLANSVSSTMW
jgi:NAD(P)-dependent dehydrogenase (short-subunit alcohol dehydrogenase family)